jgi:hypothetical protein
VVKLDGVGLQMTPLECWGSTYSRKDGRKTIGETVRKDLKVNELDPNMVYDRTLWRKLIHVADPT